MKYLKLIGKNITRKKTRMILTIGSYTVALSLFGFLVTFNDSITAYTEIGADQLFVRHKKSGPPLPYGYKEKIRQIPGVQIVTAGNFFGGFYQSEENNTYPLYAYEPEFIQVFPEYAIKKQEWEDYLKDREGLVAGRRLAEKFNWKVGDRVPIHGTIFPGIWEFNVRAIYDNTDLEDNTMGMFFHFKYFDERMLNPGVAHFYMVKIDDPEMADQVSEAIDKQFMNSPAETRTESYQAFISGFIDQLGSVRMILLTFGAAGFFSLLLVTGSTMSMSIRERTGEMGVMKTLGFSDLRVLFMTLWESVVYAVVGGGLGLFLVKLYTLYGEPPGEQMISFEFSNLKMLLGLLVAIVFGAASGIIPAVNAMRLNIVDALRRV